MALLSKSTKNVAELVVSHSTVVSSAVQVDNIGTTIKLIHVF